MVITSFLIFSASLVDDLVALFLTSFLCFTSGMGVEVVMLLVSIFIFPSNSESSNFTSALSSSTSIFISLGSDFGDFALGVFF